MFTTRRITTSGGDKFRDEYSLAFDGTDDYIVTGLAGSAFDGNFTISAWVKNDIEDIYHSIFSHYVDDNNYIQLYIPKSSATHANKAIFSGTIGGSSLYVTGSTAIFATDAWVHLVFTQDDDANAQVIYINAVSDATETRDWDMDYAGTTYIGRKSPSDAHIHQGNISEIAVYDKALSASEVKTLYNGREPYNHKEGVCSSNLQAWWRMGDGSSNNRKFQYIENSSSSAGSKLIMSSTFDSDEDGWVDYSSGTVARSTDISSHSGSAGVLKCTTDTTSQWLGKTANITSGMESGKIYIAEGYVYIPSSWSGTRDIYIYSADQFGDSATNIGEHDYNIAQHETKDEWQHIFYTFLCKEDSGSGAIYLRAAGGDNLEDGDFVYLDDFKITEIDKLNSGVIINMDTISFEGDTP